MDKKQRHDLRGRLSAPLNLADYMIHTPSEDWDVEELKSIAKICTKSVDAIIEILDECAKGEHSTKPCGKQFTENQLRFIEHLIDQYGYEFFEEESTDLMKVLKGEP